MLSRLLLLQLDLPIGLADAGHERYLPNPSWPAQGRP
jgi:hypothetical protein